MDQMKEQNKTPEKELNKCRQVIYQMQSSNTRYKDAQGT